VLVLYSGGERARGGKAFRGPENYIWGKSASRAQKGVVHEHGLAGHAEQFAAGRA